MTDVLSISLCAIAAIHNVEIAFLPPKWCFGNASTDYFLYFIATVYT